MVPRRILILGVGNILLADEGFGVRAVDYLQTHYEWPANVRLLDGGTLGLLLMAELLECDQAIVLDIAFGGGAPGTFYRIEREDLSKALSLRQSMHQTSIEDTLISCDLAGHRPEVTVFAMEPYNCGVLQAALTCEAQKRLPEFCAKVVTELEKEGILPGFQENERFNGANKPDNG